MNRSGEATAGGRVRGHAADVREEGGRGRARRADAAPDQPPRQAGAHAAQADQVTHYS